MKIFKFVLLSLFLALMGCDDSDSGGGKSVTKVLCIGDSITRGLGATSYTVFLADMLGKPVVNFGKDGRTTGEGVAVVGGAIANNQPSHLVILLGTNDAILGLNASQSIANLQGMVNAANAAGVKVIIASPPPITRNSVENARVNTLTVGILNDINGAKKVRLNNRLDASTLQADGVHPNVDGQRIIAAAVDDAL
jgi:acyl-CoA thioesterase-1